MVPFPVTMTQSGTRLFVVGHAGREIAWWSTDLKTIYTQRTTKANGKRYDGVTIWTSLLQMAEGVGSERIVMTDITADQVWTCSIEQAKSGVELPGPYGRIWVPQSTRVLGASQGVLFDDK